jgi:hypothetical protein
MLGRSSHVPVLSVDIVRLLFGDQFTTKTKGGFVVYYVSPGKGGVTAFKPVRQPCYP